MRRVAMKGLVTAVATGGVLAATGYAYADSNAAGSADSSPGVLAGNAVQLPVHIPVNVCGNTVDVLGLLNPSAGNTCANASRAAHAGRAGGSRAASGGGAHAVGGEQGSPGVLAGNGLKLPVDLPVNISGNSIGVVGALNPALGNTATNQSAPPPVRHHPAPPPPVVAPPAPPAPAPAHPVAAAPQRAALAHTGADGLGLAIPASAALLLGGGVLYRRFRGATR
ncbi:chaplin [Streptomyces sp. NPDC006530]|uniref:chaplin n=1 Tax=Streptomyces sp. NPDC006530 TaxID=3364750 RepID=UPI0036749432